MMKINVRSFAFIREALGSKQIQIEVQEGATVKDAIFSLVKIHEKLADHLVQDGNVKNDFVFALNGEQVQFSEIETTQLAENDTIVILPPAGGG
ncbi:MAG: MoaD/ThiS family protein [Methanobacteriota archaeon]|nr:MAG: MoaD/ThiS family protein [Euryarchaeota archaeon]